MPFLPLKEASSLSRRITSVYLGAKELKDSLRWGLVMRK